jgi:hypothetical protein
MTNLIEEQENDAATRKVIINLVAEDILDTIGDMLRKDAADMIAEDPDLDESDAEGLVYMLAEDMAIDELTRLFGGVNPQWN